MQAVREKLRFLGRLKDNDLDFVDIHSVHCARIMAKLRLWFTVEDYKKASFFDKSLNNCMSLAVILFTGSALMYQLLHAYETPKPILLLKIAHLLLFVIGINIIYISRKYRQEYTDVIAYVNQKSLEILDRPDKEKFRPLRNKIYLFTYGIIIPLVFGSLLAPLPYLIETITTGQLTYSTFQSLSQTPHSTSVYVQCAVQLFIIYWMLALGVSFLVAIFEPTLHFAVSYRILAEDLRGLRTAVYFSEDVEIRRLKTLLKESSEIKRFVDKANKINSKFFMLYIFLSSTLTGLLLAVSLKMDLSWESIFFVSYPCNAYAMAAILCCLGQYLTDSASEMQYAIYECDWYSAPLPFKKLVLMFLIRCKTPIIVEAKPFFELNFALLAQITKRIYVMLTMVRQFFD